MINEKSMTLLRDWHPNAVDVRGWFVSEKLDGCRAYWDGQTLWTRGGNSIEAPAWFTAGFPKCHLDGEIWAGRGNLETARRAVQYGQFGTEGACPVKFHVFDAPQAKGNWLCRIDSIRKSLWSLHAEAVAVFGELCNQDAVSTWCAAITSSGGEGLVIRNPAVKGYERGRTPNALRVLDRFVAEYY